MSTLIYARSGKRCTGKCDSNCYNATEERCTCICGGRNHGAGKSKAVDNTCKYADEMIEEYKSKHPDVIINSPLTDNVLFR